VKQTLAIASGLLALAAGLGPVQASPATLAVPRKADATFHKVRIWSFKASTLSAVGSAETLTYDRTAGRGVAEAASATLPGHGADPRPVHLSAGTAEGRVGARVLAARDGVVLSRQDGTVRTRSARFDGPTHSVAGPEAVAIDSGTAHVTGAAFTLDTITEQIELLGPVTAHAEVGP
jgi:hypothetical protein